MRARWGLTALLVAVQPASLGAQGVASVVARAEVSDVVLSVSVVQSLAFGNVTPGVPTTIDPRSSANVGEFELRGAKGTEITIDIALPVVITVGPYSMPISFGPTAGCHHNRDQQNKCAYFDPAITLVTRIRNRTFPDNLRIIWIGGTASPAVSQAAGVYQGTIGLTTAYTGN